MVPTPDLHDQRDRSEEDARARLPSLDALIGRFDDQPPFDVMAAVVAHATALGELAWPMPLPRWPAAGPDHARLIALYCNHLAFALERDGALGTDRRGLASRHAGALPFHAAVITACTACVGTAAERARIARSAWEHVARCVGALAPAPATMSEYSPPGDVTASAELLALTPLLLDDAGAARERLLRLYTRLAP